MAQCPSRAAEQYIQDQELPEQCPNCMADNGDQNGDWKCQGHEPFCCVRCEEEYMDDQAEAERRMGELFRQERAAGHI